MINNFNIKNKVIILTGGSGNLGSIYAEHLVSNEAIVCNFDLTEPKESKLFNNENYLFFRSNIFKNFQILIKSMLVFYRLIHLKSKKIRQ